MAEAPEHPHNAERGTFGTVSGVIQPMPAPRYSGTPTDDPRPAGKAGADGEALLADIGYDASRIGALRDAGALA
jgi:alpha-methylacyl-CoA racemase